MKLHVVQSDWRPEYESGDEVAEVRRADHPKPRTEEVQPCSPPQ